MHIYELETERVDALDDAVESGLIHELALEARHPLLGPQLELREGRPQDRARLTAERELVGLAHDVALGPDPVLDTAPDPSSPLSLGRYDPEG